VNLSRNKEKREMNEEMAGKERVKSEILCTIMPIENQGCEKMAKSTFTSAEISQAAKRGERCFICQTVK